MELGGGRCCGLAPPDVSFPSSLIFHTSWFCWGFSSACCFDTSPHWRRSVPCLLGEADGRRHGKFTELMTLQRPVGPTERMSAHLFLCQQDGGENGVGCQPGDRQTGSQAEGSTGSQLQLPLGSPFSEPQMSSSVSAPSLSSPPCGSALSEQWRCLNASLLSLHLSPGHQVCLCLRCTH